MRIGLQQDIPPCLPMAAGRYYFVPNSTSTSTNATHGNERLRLVPCFIPQRIAVTRIGAEVTSAGEAGSKVRLGIYEHDPATSRPGALVVDAGQIDGTDASVQELTVTNVTIGPGWYWFGAALQSAPSAQPTIRTCAPGSIVPPIDLTGSIPPASQIATGYLQDGVSGALPVTAGVTDMSGGTTTPRIFIKT